MRLLDELAGEHRRIEPLLFALRTYGAARRAGDPVDPTDGDRFLDFLRLYAGHFHHGREEEVLFVALVEQVELPRERGPIAALLEQHRQLAALLDELAPLLPRPALAPAEGERLWQLVDRYTRDLLLHLDAEDSVLLVESHDRLRRAGVLELPSRGESPQEAAARDGGAALVARYPATVDPTLIRGEACVICPSFGRTCDGVEREWWSEQEWDEFSDHVG